MNMNNMMQKPAVLLAGFLTIAIPMQATAAETTPTSKQLLSLIEAQQHQLNALKAALVKAQREAEGHAMQTKKASEASDKSNFLNSIKIGGAIEVEATNSETFAGVNSSDITLAKVEAYIDAKPFEYVSTHIQMIYEDDGNENINLDEATITLGDAEKFPAYVVAGKWAMPFGGFDTAMNTDPLTKNLGETKEAAVLVGLTKNGLTAEAFGYNGDTQKSGESDKIDQFGLNLGYATEINGAAVSIGGSYISNLSDSDTLTSTLDTNATALNEYVGGAEMHGSLGIGPVTFYGGYMTATKSFQSGEVAFNSLGARPVAWNTELAYTTELAGKEVVFAATIQGTDEALALSLPEKRYGGAITVGIMEKTSVTVEYLHDEDYGVNNGGTGNNAQTATLKLAVEF